MFGLFSSFFNAGLQRETNMLNAKMHQQDIAAQYNMQAKAQQYAMQNFEAENAEYDRRYQQYMSPQAQVQARLDAGLNPYTDPSTFGSGSAGGNIGTPQGPSASVPTGNPMQAAQMSFDPRSIADFLKLPKEIALLASQAHSNESQAGSFDSESAYKTILTKLFDEDLPFRKTLNQLGISDLLATIGEKNSHSRLMKSETEFNNNSMDARINQIASQGLLNESMSSFYDQQLLYYQALGKWIDPQAQAQINYLYSQVGTQKAMQRFYNSTADSNRVDMANKLAGSFEAFSSSLRELGLSENAIREQYNIASQMLITTAENLKALCDQNISEAERRALVVEAERNCPPWLREGGIAHQFLTRVSEGADIIQTAKGIFKKVPKPSKTARTEDVITTDHRGRSSTTHRVVQDVDLP